MILYEKFVEATRFPKPDFFTTCNNFVKSLTEAKLAKTVEVYIKELKEVVNKEIVKKVIGNLLNCNFPFG